ncbi:MAG: hypothetical protein R2912_01455 [Eubacteriales bacterium]
MGAIDVIPFIPIREVSMEESVALSQIRRRARLGRGMHAVFLYEASASAPHRGSRRHPQGTV